MFVKMRPTLQRVFAFSLLALLMGLALLFHQVLNGWEQTILQSSERYRDLASGEVAERVTTYLDEAPLAVVQFEKQIKYGLVDSKKIDSVEEGLLSLLLANGNISEATLTYADSKGTDKAGNILIDRASAGQVSVLRSTTAGEFVSKRTWLRGTHFVSQARALTRKALARATPTRPVVASGDPTAHPTFQTAANRFYGQLIPTDLYWSQMDELLPEARRRVELSVQKTVEDSGHFAGVLRVGLLKSKIDGAVRQHIGGVAKGDPHLIFLCDNQGRLITGFGESGSRNRFGGRFADCARRRAASGSEGTPGPGPEECRCEPAGCRNFLSLRKRHLSLYLSLPARHPGLDRRDRSAP